MDDILSILLDEALERGECELDEGLLRNVYTLNTWGDAKRAEARKYLEQGYFVRFCSTCIGHTRSAMVERDGIKWAAEEYGLSLMLRKRKGWGEWYVALR